MFLIIVDIIFVLRVRSSVRLQLSFLIQLYYIKIISASARAPVSIQIVWLFRAQCSPDGAQGTMWALFRTEGYPDHLSSFGSTLKPFLPYGFPATALISESFRNNHPIETGFHSEWLRYNPKGPRGPIPPRAPKAPLGTLGYPGVPLGPLGPTPRDRHLVEATERRLESLVAERLYRREDTGSAACA